MGISLEPLSHSARTDAPELRVIERYMAQTADGSDVCLAAAFRLQRRGEAERISKWNHVAENRLLLWHGSGAANFVGILTQGLRVAPPEAPVSGYAFGKGVYFADMFGEWDPRESAEWSRRRALSCSLRTPCAASACAPTLVRAMCSLQRRPPHICPLSRA